MMIVTLMLVMNSMAFAADLPDCWKEEGEGNYLLTIDNALISSDEAMTILAKVGNSEVVEPTRYPIFFQDAMVILAVKSSPEADQAVTEAWLKKLVKTHKNLIVECNNKNDAGGGASIGNSPR